MIDGVRIEPGRKRVRAYLAGVLVADTVRPVLVWEKPQYPTYYLPAEDVHATLVPTGRVSGGADVFDVMVAGATAAGAARWYRQPEHLVRLDWDAMDEWLEEDEPVYTHPRDPYTRVDVLASSRHVTIDVDGVRLAESRQPRILFETGLPPRYYLPMTDVRVELLRPSRTRTHCPYKGTATYWSVVIGRTVHQDLAWTYRSPLPESQKIAGLVCCYDERVDVCLDGVLQERPRTSSGSQVADLGQ